MNYNTKIAAPLRVLYIEDDLNTREEIAFFLEGVVSELYLAGDGVAGYEAYKKHLPDLIITDIQMPRMNGIEMIQKIRQEDKQIPILIASAYNETDYLLNAINIGVNRYIIKPINLTQLMDSIAECFLANENHHCYIVLNQQGLVTNMSVSALNLLDYTQEEINNQSISAFLNEADYENAITFLSNLERGVSNENCSVSLKRKNGETIDTIWEFKEKFVTDDGRKFKIEFKNIEAYAKNEVILNTLLEYERFTKSLIQIQAMINEIILIETDKVAFMQKIVKSFTSKNDFEYAYAVFMNDAEEMSIVAQSPDTILDLIAKPPLCISQKSPFLCPVYEAITTEKIVVIKEMFSYKACQKEYLFLNNKNQAMLVLPIQQYTSKSIKGALCLFLKKEFHLEEETLKLFENISQLIILGFKSIDNQIIRNELQVALRNERDFMDSILKNVGVIVIVFNTEGSIVKFNKTAEEFTGYSAQEVIEKPYFLTNLLLPEEQEKVLQIFKSACIGNVSKNYENYWVSKNGEKRLFSWHNSTILNENGNVEFILSVGYDTTEQKRNEEIIKHLAFYDTLTQLPNRLLFYDRLKSALAMSNRSQLYGALIFLDLDNFKSLNDTYGHIAGDLLLSEVANRIKSSVREIDTVARFGGDEFVILLTEIHIDKENATHTACLIAEKILSALSKEYHITFLNDQNKEISICHHTTASIGIRPYVGSIISQDELIVQADYAMYEAKQSGKNQIRLFQSKE